MASLASVLAEKAEARSAPAAEPSEQQQRETSPPGPSAASARRGSASRNNATATMRVSVSNIVNTHVSCCIQTRVNSSVAVLCSGVLGLYVVSRLGAILQSVR